MGRCRPGPTYLLYRVNPNHSCAWSAAQSTLLLFCSHHLLSLPVARDVVNALTRGCIERRRWVRWYPPVNGASASCSCPPHMLQPRGRCCTGSKLRWSWHLATLSSQLRRQCQRQKRLERRHHTVAGSPQLHRSRCPEVASPAHSTSGKAEGERPSLRNASDISQPEGARAAVIVNLAMRCPTRWRLPAWPFGVGACGVASGEAMRLDRIALEFVMTGRWGATLARKGAARG